MAAPCSLFHACARHTARRAVREIARPDTVAFRTFVQRHQAEVFSLVSAVVGDHPDQADVIAQDIFARAYKNIATSGLCDNDRIWLCRLAIQRIRMHLRMQRLRYWVSGVWRLTGSDSVRSAGQDTSKSKSWQRDLLLSLAPEIAD